MTEAVIVAILVGYGMLMTYHVVSRGERLAKSMQDLEVSLKTIEALKTQFDNARHGNEQRIKAYADEVASLKKFILGTPDGPNIDFTRLMSKKGYHRDS